MVPTFTFTVFAAVLTPPSESTPLPVLVMVPPALTMLELMASPIWPLVAPALVTVASTVTGSTCTLIDEGRLRLPLITGTVRTSSRLVEVIVPPEAIASVPEPVFTWGPLPPTLPPMELKVRAPMVSL